MALSVKEKREILSFIRENFNWCSAELLKSNSFYDMYFKHNMHETDFEFRSGCSKYCLLNPFFEDYVIKFSTGRFDYCEREYKNYWAAVYNHLEEYFPYTIFLGDLNGLKLYIQEKAVCDSQAVSDIWYERVYNGYWSEENAKEAAESGEIWAVIDELDDYERVGYIYDDDKLWDFLDEYRINDLHEGNFGYVGERLVIIDFSGFGFFMENREF